MNHRASYVASANRGTTGWNLVQEMFVDENKDITPYYTEMINGIKERTYTDHCTITMTMNQTVRGKTAPTHCNILDKDGYVKFRKRLEEEKVSEIIDDGDIQKSYKMWNDKVLRIRDTCMRRVKIRKQWKVNRKLTVVKKRITRELRYTTNKERIRTLKDMKNVVREQIEEEEHKKKFIRIERIVASIKKDGGVNSKTFWEVRSKLMGRSNDNAHAMLDENGVKRDKPEEILEVHSTWYKKLLTTRPAETEIEKHAEEVIDMVSISLKTIAMHKSPRETTWEEVEEVVKNLNPKKAKDSATWRNSLIIEGGDEMKRSLQKIINQVDRQAEIPKEWEKMEILSNHKKGDKMLMSNKRGLFLTNNISKVYERVVKRRNDEKFRKGITKWQTGGVTRRAPIDNVFLMLATIEQNKYLKKNTYIVFTDAEKCFDKLWLDDGIFELWRCGTDIRDCMMIKKLNEKAEVLVRTPVGNTPPFILLNIVRQGTVYGPQICISSMDKINLIGKDVVTFYGPELPIRAGVFIDDVESAGEVTAANNVIYNCNILEERKKMTFSTKNGKTEYMVIGDKSTGIESITNEVKNGKIERVEEHKALGTWFDESGNYGINTTKKKEQLKFMIYTTKREAHPKDIGIYAAEARLKLAEVVVIQSILNNSEAFANHLVKETEELEHVQHTILTGLLEIPSITPYYLVLMETGWWTMKARIEYKKLMLFHNITRSDEERVIKAVLERQKKEDRPKTWHSNIQKLIKQYGIKLDASNSSKSQWKKHVKKLINSSVEKEVRNKCESLKKGRTIRNDRFEKKAYIGKVPLNVLRKIMKYRTHMTTIPGNFKANTDGECLLCRKEKGATEHYFTCTETRDVAEAWEVEEKDLLSNDIKKMTMVANFMEKVELLLEPQYKNQK